MVPKSISPPAAPTPFARRSLRVNAWRAPASVRRYRVAVPSYGTITPTPDSAQRSHLARSPYRFETGYAVCPKRPSRPFPPPFLSLPSHAVSDPLTERRLSVRGELVRGLTNGDDAVLVAENFIGVNDGVGAWATKPQGHAALWSRLVLHFWALEVEREVSDVAEPDAIGFLQRAYEETVEATTVPTEWLGTTTSVTALLHHCSEGGEPRPLLYVTNLGDCQVLVIRPREKKILFKTVEQWHWFDCPLQLGTNSSDRPDKDAVLSKVELEENDIVVAVSDGVIDNLWEHELLAVILESVEKWESGHGGEATGDRSTGAGGGMVYVAREVLKAAHTVAQDPFAESPYMEKAVDEGLAMEGGKLDDISVVLALCKKRQV
ncbi:hypothetical protein VTN02DRAFT_484 [Thermoascus thermophilus]